MKKEYFIFVNGEKVIVTEEVYKAYWQVTNRENYLKQLDRDNQLFLFCDFDHDGHFESNLVDESVDVEKLVETKMCIEALHKVLAKLNDDEREIIEKLFFSNESMSSLARKKSITYQAVQWKRDNILKKLKKMMEEIF